MTPDHMAIDGTTRLSAGNDVPGQSRFAVSGCRPPADIPGVLRRTICGWSDGGRGTRIRVAADGAVI